jgi:hypothetical protein
MVVLESVVRLYTRSLLVVPVEIELLAFNWTLSSSPRQDVRTSRALPHLLFGLSQYTRSSLDSSLPVLLFLRPIVAASTAAKPTRIIPSHVKILVHDRVGRN